MTVAHLLKRGALASLFLVCIGAVGTLVCVVMRASEKLGRYGPALPAAVGLAVYAWLWAGKMLKERDRG